MATKLSATKLSDKAILEYYPEILSCSQDEFEEEWKSRPAETIFFHAFGKKCKFNRKVRMYGSKPYAFSGIVVKADPTFSVLAQRALDLANKMYPGFDFNSVLVNYYDGGKDYISAHSDDEKEHKKGAPIVGFNVYGEGPPRTFRIKNSTTRKVVKDLATEHGSMFTMIGMQDDFTHEIPKSTRKTNPFGRRISFTVRCFV